VNIYNPILTIEGPDISIIVLFRPPPGLALLSAYLCATVGNNGCGVQGP